MMIPELFQRFFEFSPVWFLARALLENALPTFLVDGLTQINAHRQSNRSLLFSDVVNL